MQVRLAGIEPKPGANLCATCVMLFMREISLDEQLREQVKKLTEDYRNAELDWIVYNLPKRPDLPLETAVTIAPSMYIQASLPVCWTHVVALGSNPVNNTSGLIPGKSYQRGVG